MICFENVVYRNDGRALIDGVSFALRKGDFAVLIGANGAGKTTLSKLCMGLLKPAEGSVRIRGFDTKTTKTSLIAKKVGFLFQNPDRQICQNSVREEVRFGLQCVMDDHGKIEQRTEETVARLGFDGGTNPFSLSRGERQKLVLALLLAAEPEILILDEPTTGLDYRECTEIMEAVRAAQAQGTTILMVTHDMEIVLDYASRVFVLNEGRMLCDAPMKEIMKNEAVLAQAALLPAQMPALAMRLGDGFERVYTTEEMVAMIEMKKERAY